MASTPRHLDRATTWSDTHPPDWLERPLRDGGWMFCGVMIYRLVRGDGRELELQLEGGPHAAIWTQERVVFPACCKRGRRTVDEWLMKAVPAPPTRATCSPCCGEAMCTSWPMGRHDQTSEPRDSAAGIYWLGELLMRVMSRLLSRWSEELLPLLLLNRRCHM